MIRMRSTRLECSDDIDILIVVAIVFVWQRCRIFWMRRLVSFCNLCTLHIDFHDAKATYQIGVDAIHTNAANCFVACQQFVVEIADIGDIAFHVY